MIRAARAVCTALVILSIAVLGGCVFDSDDGGSTSEKVYFDVTFALETAVGRIEAIAASYELQIARERFTLAGRNPEYVLWTSHDVVPNYRIADRVAKALVRNHPGEVLDAEVQRPQYVLD